MCLAALVIISRLPHVLGAECADSDACIVVLMARHMANGEIAPYFWGQRYMGSLEPLLLAPLAPLQLATATAGALIGVALSIVQTWMVARLAVRAGASPFVAALLFAVPAFAAGLHQTILYGARHVATLLGLWMLERSLRAAPGTTRTWLWTGAIGGVAFYGDHLMLMFIVPALIAAWREGMFRRALFGFVPFVLLDVALATTTAAGRHSWPQEPGHWLRGIEILARSVPQLFGLDGIGAVVGIVAILAVVVIMGRHHVKGGASLALRLIALSLALCVGLHVAGALDANAGLRYLVPGLGPFAVLAAHAVGHVRKPWPALLVVGLVVPRLATYSSSAATDGHACRTELARVVSDLERLRVGAIWANYWDAYRIAVVSEERWPVAIPTRRNRYPEWTHQARAAHRVAYVVRDNDNDLHDKVVMAAPNARWVRSGRYRIAVVPSTLPGLEGLD